MISSEKFLVINLQTCADPTKQPAKHSRVNWPGQI